MTSTQTLLAVLALMTATFFPGCSSDGGRHEGENPEEHLQEGEQRGEGGGGNGGDGGEEHDRDGDEHGEGGHHEEGDESGTELALGETYDQVRNVARLILVHDSDSNAFVGTVENTTKEILERVRVEVHLPHGKEVVGGDHR